MCIYTGRWICRRWLLNTRLIQFVFYAGIAVLLFSLFGILVLRQFSRDHNTGIIITIVGVVTGFLLLGSFLSITRSTIVRLIRETTIARDQRESELKLLRSQLSPHFLFNVLNNLYGLSIQQDKRVPGLILKLSDLLRHSLYDTQCEFIPLANELAYIDNYIELERIRMGEKLFLQADIQNTGISEINIAPMLLMVFIENAFKHSKNTLLQEIHINIELRIDAGKLTFAVRNSCSDKPVEENSEDESGIGLAVTTRRLELLYPGKYSLEKKQQLGFYEVTLQLYL
jgi:LytS/YehU family sensor histidine kinase